MHGLEIHVDVAPGKRREFLVAVESLLEAESAAGSASASCRVFEQLGLPNHFLWREEWTDRAALDLRVSSNEFRAVVGALRILGEAHELRFTREEKMSAEELTPWIGTRLLFDRRG